MSQRSDELSLEQKVAGLYEALELEREFTDLPRERQVDRLGDEMAELMGRMKELGVLMNLSAPHLPDFAFYDQFKDEHCEGLLFNGKELHRLAGRYCKLHSLWELLKSMPHNGMR